MQTVRVATYNSPHLQHLMDRFSKVCTVFKLTISLKKKTNVLAQAGKSRNNTINSYQLEVVEESTYLESTISSKLLFDKEIRQRIGKADYTCVHLRFQVLEPCMYRKTKLLTMIE